jgi:hypothetical protein
MQLQQALLVLYLLIKVRYLRTIQLNKTSFKVELRKVPVWAGGFLNTHIKVIVTVSITIVASASDTIKQTFTSLQQQRK